MNSPQQGFESWSMGDHLRHLIRHTPLILLVAFAGAVASYSGAGVQAQALLRLGRLQSLAAPESPTDVTVRVNAPTFLQTLVAPNSTSQALKGASLSANINPNTQLITIIAKAQTASVALGLLSRAERCFSEEHAAFFKRYRERSKARAQEVEGLIQRFETVLSADSLRKEKTDIGSLLTQQAALDRLSQLQKERFELRSILEKSDEEMTRFLEPPTLIAGQGTKRAVFMGASGFGFGIVLAYVIDAIRRTLRASSRRDAKVTTSERTLVSQ